MVVACLALAVAVGGTAVAAGGGFVGSDGVIHGCVTGKGKLTLVKPGKSCNKGKSISWNQKGQNGTNGTNGTNGSAIAFAHVMADGTLDLARSKNITAESHPVAADGYYCITTAVAVRNAVVTMGGLSGNITANVFVGDDPLSSCPVGATTTVQMWNGSTASNEEFYIAFN